MAKNDFQLTTPLDKDKFPTHPGHMEQSDNEDNADAAIVLHVSNNLGADSPDSPDVLSQIPHDIHEWHWFDGQLEDQVDDDYVEKIVNITGLSAKKIVPKLRYILLCFYFFVHVVLVVCFSRCSSEHSAENTHSENNMLNVSNKYRCSTEEKLLRSFKYPLISIIGVIIISFITRIVMCLAALYTWRCSKRRALATTLGPFCQMHKLLFLLIVSILIIVIYLLSSYAFQDQFYFDWVEVFAPAGLATIITVTFGFDTDTDFEECLKREKGKDGYVHGLAHQYFKSSLDPLLRPDGKRKDLAERWKTYCPAETLLVMLVESYYLVEEFFANADFSHEAEFVEEVDGVYLMKLAVAENGRQTVYVNIPVLLNTHLLIIDECFADKPHSTVPLAEQKSEYVKTLRGLLKDRRLPKGGTMSRIFFITIPNVHIRSITRIIRKQIYKELGEPTSDKFLENTKFAEKYSP